jgi:hypothetical protein
MPMVKDISVEKMRENQQRCWRRADPGVCGAPMLESVVFQGIAETNAPAQQSNSPSVQRGCLLSRLVVVGSSGEERATKA